MNNILVTGAGGLIGGIIIEKIHNNNFVGLDIVVSKYPKTIISDISDIEKLENIMLSNRIDTVIHLAAYPSVSDEWEIIRKNNIEGTRNVFDASMIAKVKKIIFASSNHAVGLYENDDPYKKIISGNYDNLEDNFDLIKPDCLVRPDSYYGVSKAFGENLGRYFHEKYGIKIACLRIGTVNKDNSPLSGTNIKYDSKRFFSTWCSHDDLAGLIEACINSEKVTFNIFFGVSNNKWKIWDISNQKRILNYSPKSNAESFR